MSHVSPRRIRDALIGGLAVFSLNAPAAADPGHHGQPFGSPAKASQATRTVTVTMRDSLFEPESLNVRPGEIVRFMLVNKGELLHEFNIGTAAMHAEHQEEMAMLMDHGMLTATGINHHMPNMDPAKMGGMSMAEMKHDHANSVLVEPGKTAELVWKFSQPMALEFACNIPGHYEAGMAGPFNFTK